MTQIFVVVPVVAVVVVVVVVVFRALINSLVYSMYCTVRRNTKLCFHWNFQSRPPRIRLL